MQVLLRGYEITETSQKDFVLKLLANDHAMAIIEATTGSPKSALEISTGCQIPLTQVYRWLRKLHEIGFLRTSGATNSAGKKYFMYQSKITSITITLNASSPQIQVS